MIKLLDCTLRDGGYCNEWDFGYEYIKKIVTGLNMSGIEIVECGFLTMKTEHRADITKFNNISEMASILPDQAKAQFVCMMNFGEYNITELPVCDGSSVTGIRLAFHKKDRKEAMLVAEEIKKKGYFLFLQPMVSLRYSDEEFLSLIQEANSLEPSAFYIVDSFGVMKQKDLMRFYYLVENNLLDDIAIGFHSHNNMQLSYSNAQALVGLGSQHMMIIDASIYGMGRGAGNLNTELFVEYMNDYYKTSYQLKPLLQIIDEVLNPIHQRKPWGYSLPNYLSAKYNAHPNYAIYLSERNTLTIDNMDDIFSAMDADKRASYDKSYIEQMYIRYLASGEETADNLQKFMEIVKGRTILIIAPGQSSFIEKEKIIQAVGENTVVISVNFDYPEIETNFIFLSNLRKYRALPKEKLSKCIVTSNISTSKAYIKVDYKKLLNKHEVVFDNAGLMLIELMIQGGCQKIQLAGFDGYDELPVGEGGERSWGIETSHMFANRINEGLVSMLREFATQVTIELVTTPKYVII